MVPAMKVVLVMSDMASMNLSSQATSAVSADRVVTDRDISPNLMVYFLHCGG